MLDNSTIKKSPPAKRFTFFLFFFFLSTFSLTDFKNLVDSYNDLRFASRKFLKLFM